MNVWKPAFLSLAFIFLLSGNISAQTNDSIPFLYRGHLYVSSTINDTIHSNIIYDTGASNIFGVDSVFLANSGWTPSNLRWAMAGGGAGGKRVQIIMGKTKVKIGNMESTYPIVPIYQLRDVVSCHVDGICGIKDIADYPLEINFENSYLKFHKSGMPNTDGYEKLHIMFEENRIMILANTVIGGTEIQGWYLMDTGSGSSVDFTAKAMQQFKMGTIPGKRYIKDILQFGIGDKKQESLVNMQSDLIIIGNDTIRKKPISYIPEGTGAFGNQTYIGVIGNDIWHDYNIIIDAKNNSLYLRRFKPSKPEGPTYDYKFRNRTDIGKGWTISSLIRGGDAESAGIELGDIITAINGKNVVDYTWDEEYDMTNIPKQTIDISSSDGKEKHVILEAKELW